jgi:hypothetical protein
VLVLGIIAWIVTGRLIGVGWDGYSIWQLKAQAFIHDGNLSVLRDAHYSSYAHLDYPLLVPLQTWWIGTNAGGYREAWAQLIGLLFALDLLVLFIAFAKRWVRREPLLLGSALLVTLPVFIQHATSGFADIEMAGYLLAMAMFLARVIVGGERKQSAALAWMFASVVVVKNEGLLAAVAGLAVILAMWWRELPRNPARFVLAALAALAASISYLPWLAFKRAWHLTNDILEGGAKPRLTAGVILSRAETIVAGFVRCLAQIGPRSGAWGLLIILLPLGLSQTIKKRVSICGPLWLLCACQTVGYALIYLITPHDLRRHIASSVDRLLLHLVPTLLLAALIGTFHEPPSESS